MKHTPNSHVCKSPETIRSPRCERIGLFVPAEEMKEFHYDFITIHIGTCSKLFEYEMYNGNKATIGFYTLAKYPQSRTEYYLQIPDYFRNLPKSRGRFKIYLRFIERHRFFIREYRLRNRNRCITGYFVLLNVNNNITSCPWILMFHTN